MKANLKTLAIATCLALGTCTYAQEGFVRPELSYNFASLKGSDASGSTLKDAGGYAVAAGASFGAQNEHEIGISVGVANFWISGSSGAYGKVKTMPILANYRYYLGTKANSARFYLAPSVGNTSVKVNESNKGSTFSSSNTSFNWGGGIGALFKVADKFDVDLGFRYMEGIKIKDTNIHVQVNTLYIGANFRF